MNGENIVVLRFRMTRNRALMALSLLFLCWHPRPLGSETLQLTTYYPAPYGGYVSILTTGNTYLARDSGNVGIGTSSPSEKLFVAGNMRSSGQVQWGGANGLMRTDQGASMELGGTNQFGGPGTPYIDFSQTTGQDYSARFWLPSAGTLQVLGNLSVTGDIQRGGAGTLSGFCSAVSYANGTTWCPAGRTLVGQYPTGSCISTGQLFKGGSLEAPGNWIPHYESGCTGVMICCNFSMS